MNQALDAVSKRLMEIGWPVVEGDIVRRPEVRTLIEYVGESELFENMDAGIPLTEGIGKFQDVFDLGDVGGMDTYHTRIPHPGRRGNGKRGLAAEMKPLFR